MFNIHTTKQRQIVDFAFILYNLVAIQRKTKYNGQ